MDDEKIGAFLDRELSKEERDLCDRALAENPGAAMRARVMKRADDLLRRALPPKSEPSDHVLTQRILTAGPIRPPLSTPIVRQFAAIAAACILGVLFGSLIQRPGSPLLSLGADSALLQSALDNGKTGETREIEGGLVTIALTVRTSDGYCRQIRVGGQASSTDALACRLDGRWTIAFAAPAQAQVSEYQAAEAAQSAFDSALGELGDIALVEEDEEARLIASGWR